MILTNCSVQKVPFCSFSLGRSATPHFERYHLLYQLDKFIKNTIWWGLCSVLYFQVFWFSTFFMLEFLLQFTSLVYKKILPKPTVLFLFIYLFLICQLSSFYSNPCCKRKQKRGLQIQKFFFSTVHTAGLLWQIWFAFMEQKSCASGKHAHSVSRQKKMVKGTGQLHQNIH